MSSNRKLAHAAFFATAEQGLSSLINFGMGLLMVRYATKDIYGLYGIGYSGLLLISGVAAAVVSTQLSVIAPHLPERERDQFFADLAGIQVTMMVPIAALVAVVAGLAGWAGLFDPAMARISVIAALGAPALMFHEFCKTLLFYRFQAQFVFLLGACQGMVWIGFGAAAWFGGLLAPNEAILIGACLGSACAAAVGWRLVKLPRWRGGREQAMAFGLIWKQGGWSLLGLGVNWLQSQSYNWTLAFLIGPAATAEANLARLFFAPLPLLLTALSRVATPHLAQFGAKTSKRAVAARGRVLLVGVVALVAIYCVCLWAFKDVALALAAHRGYTDTAPLLAAWGIVTVIQVIRWNSSMLLQVFRLNRQMTLISVISATAATAAAIGGIYFVGIIGSILGIGLGELIFGVLLWRLVRGTIVDEQRDRAASMTPAPADQR